MRKNVYDMRSLNWRKGQNIRAGRWDRVRTTRIGIVNNFVMTGGAVIFNYVFNHQALLMVLPSTGSVMTPLLITIISLWGIRIPLTYAFVDKYDLDAVWGAFL
ncbi:hypothetical protein ABEW32_20205 [Paenibacillus jamilae]